MSQHVSTHPLLQELVMVPESHGGSGVYYGGRVCCGRASY